jgi:hypothetical protein
MIDRGIKRRPELRLCRSPRIVTGDNELINNGIKLANHARYQLLGKKNKAVVYQLHAGC